ncbi:hypothetical protein N7493_004668 [Penicillium malachiteum]|uniref:Uncharacterized protein n=1 Tax=Penicillium malachiteum TaxID=1324776 RepID=A0AAD6MX88_9EURO|nr:hypothetical protein N7493_004668 [Penicillium malachiteum]
MASPALGVRDSGSSFCVSPIEELNNTISHEPNISTGDYFGDLPASTVNADTPSSKVSPPRSKKKAVAFKSGVPEEIPSLEVEYSPADEEPPAPQASFLNPAIEPPKFREPQYEKFENDRLNFNRSPNQGAAYERKDPEPPSFREPDYGKPDFEQPSVSRSHQAPTRERPVHAQAAPWEAHSGEPTLAKPGKGDSHPTTSQKPTSSFLNWGREQFHSKKIAQAARSRIANFSKTEGPPLKDTEPWLREGAHRGRRKSASRGGAHEKRPIRASHTYGTRRPSLTGFVPTTVTTITAGGPSTLPQRPAKSQQHNPRTEQRALGPEPKLDTTIDTMRLTADVQFGGVTIVPRTGSPAPSPRAQDSQSDSPGDSPRDATPQHDSSGEDKSTDETPSIMSRRRPIPISMPISKKPLRKPTPAEASQEPNGVEKTLVDLPKDPVSRVRAMEAQRDDLEKRRANLETVVRELTRVIQPTAIAYDRAAKEEVKRTVQSMENEIADIKREEHSLGMKISRAWRRVDENSNNGDGSNLWIKRVTS